MQIIEHTYKLNGYVNGPRKKTTEIILHCTATPEGRDYTVDTIDRWHKAKKWACIGYHYVIYRDGSIHRGRAKDTIGAHCQGHNANSVGVCYVGGLAKDGKTAKDTRTPEQREAMHALVEELKHIYPAATVHCHNEFASKACPSFKITEF